MKIAIFGSTSNIAKDVIAYFSQKNNLHLKLFSRRDKNFCINIQSEDRIQKFYTLNYDDFDRFDHYDAIINFIGIGTPTHENKSSLVCVADYFDSIILDYLNQNKACKYIYISSGTVYGGNFSVPIQENFRDLDHEVIGKEISNYAKSKLNCEIRHRENKFASIYDLRIFNYFSHRLNISPGLLMSDICRSIADKNTLIVNNINITRDYIDPDDFCILLEIILKTKIRKMVIDCRSKKTIAKFELLELMKTRFGLNYEISNNGLSEKNNLIKKNYYSLMNNDHKLGFSPKYSSADSLIKEVNKVIAINAGE